MVITLIILVIASAFFVSGKVRSDIVALCALLALMISGVLTPEEALSGFSNNVVIMMIGLFVVGGAIFQTGLAKKISSRILKFAGTSEIRLFLLVMLVTGAIGAFVSNTGTVALMLPIVVSMAHNAGINSRRLLMPLAFASSMGGMMTLIGTPPNLIVSDTLAGAGFEPLSFFSFTPVGLICIVTGILVLLPLTKWFLNRKETQDSRMTSGKTLVQLAKEYDLSSNLFRLRAVQGSKAVGKTIVDMDVRKVYKLNVLEIRRIESAQHRFLKTVTQKLASAGTVIRNGDVLYVTGSISSVEMFVKDMGLELLDEHDSEMTTRNGKSLAFYDIGIAEILLMPSSGILIYPLATAAYCFTPRIDSGAFTCAVSSRVSLMTFLAFGCGLLASKSFTERNIPS